MYEYAGEHDRTPSVPRPAPQAPRQNVVSGARSAGRGAHRLERLVDGSVLQRAAWTQQSDAAIKAEFVRRTEIDNSLFTELVAASGGKKSGPYDVIDLAAVQTNGDYAKLAIWLRKQFPSAHIRPDTPYHENEEKKLPVWSRDAYIEMGYAGGGTRLVVDVIQKYVYISAHYRSFYILEDNGPPAAVLTPAVAKHLEVQAELAKH